jgi:internalin A
MNYLKRIIVVTLSLASTSVLLAQTFKLPDDNFKKCLKDRFPSTINNNGDLIIAEANKATGRLTCNEYEIENLDGIQYFTSIDILQAQQNNIKYVPSLNDLKDLVQLDLNKNELTELPDISKLSKLVKLSVQQNNISALPNLSNHPLLTNLVVHNNNLKIIPSLDKLTKLEYVNVAHNELKELPSLDKLVALHTIHCFANELSSLPRLDSLKSLEHIEAHNNKLTLLPNLPKTCRIRNFYANNNFITKLPDFSNCSSLEKVRMYGNDPLTFEDYVPLTSINKFDSIFKPSPQRPYKVGKKSAISEGDSLVLATGIDKNVQNVMYEWYKNGKLIKTVTNDYFKIPATTLSDSGKYTCVLKHPVFNIILLVTDTFYVSITPCVDFGELNFNIAEISCLTTGTLAITGSKHPIATYELIGKNTGKIYSNSTGKFTGLSETNYSLTLKSANGCVKKYANPIIINQKECEETILSPDGDGQSDSYYFPENGKVIIYNKQGEVMKTLLIPGEWNGYSDKGKVSSGFYVADINNGTRLIGITVLY